MRRLRAGREPRTDSVPPAGSPALETVLFELFGDRSYGTIDLRVVALDYLTIALPKGRLLEPAVEMLNQAGVFTSDVSDDTRRLVFDDPDRRSRDPRQSNGRPDIRAIRICRSGYLRKGRYRRVTQGRVRASDLKMGRCRFVVAVPASSHVTDVSGLGFNFALPPYPYVARNYFASLGVQVEIVTLNGSLELAPAVGLADAIVDITETGRTLRDNGLKVIADMWTSTARLIANRVSYRARRSDITEAVQRLSEVMAGQ